MKIKAPKDFWAGVLFIALGAAFVIASQNYTLGTAFSMGPGYFPTLLGGLLALLGVIVLVQGLTTEGEALSSFHLRSVFIVLLSLCVFGALVRSTGLVPATLAVVIISSFASHEFHLKSTLALAVGLTVFSVLVFYYGLGLPFQLWPGH